MCGIVGILSQRPVAHDLVDALRRLEYRGYDSAGVATVENGHLERRRADLGWTYERPLPEAVAIRGLVAFWDELVDVYLDGERRERATGPFADALRDEFGLQLPAATPATAGPRS